MWKTVAVAAVGSLVVGLLVSFGYFNTRTAPQRAAAKQLADEADALIARLAREEHISDVEYRKMQATLDRLKADGDRLLEEKSRIRRRSHALGVIVVLVVFGASFVGSLVKRRVSAANHTDGPEVTDAGGG